MSTALMERPEQSPDLRTIRGQVTETSYIPPSDMEFQEWSHTTELLSMWVESGNWYLGDALRYGEAKWPDIYSQVMDATRMQLDTLQRASYVATKFPPERRRGHPLSWSHHRVLASLPPADQDRWLDRCEAEDLKVEQLRALKSNGQIATKDAPCPVQLVQAFRSLPGRALSLWGEEEVSWTETVELEEIRVQLTLRVQRF